MHLHSHLDLLGVAEAAARTAGDHALAHKHRRTEKLASYAHDVKLVLDQECQTLATEVIRKQFPTHPILGEEGRTKGIGDITWVIDPIDGTVNFSRGIPHWCCSVAAKDERGNLLCACVYLPESGACFTAGAGKPAALNREPIRVADTPCLADAMVLLGLGDGGGLLEKFAEIYRRSHKLRLLGAAAADFCSVACGRADAVVSPGLYEWDVAGGELILRQAGGVVLKGPKDDKGRFPIIAGRKEIVGELSRLLPEFV
ncbi:MAG: inositol monophosphatase [Verrucomicrobia bacterium]|nr:inositol monophosphatase [Verrucomicrobiota bacterium]MCH8513859.1 inositol monophosphatase [Kiritimatiellia bacterium]